MESKIKLLIVEDHRQLCDSLTKYFKGKDDIEVVGACAGPLEAAGLIEQTAPDAMVLDMVMPGADGFSLLERLGAGEFRRAPETIVISAVGSDAMVKQAYDLGAKYYLLKPISEEVLYRRILDLFGRRQAPVRTAGRAARPKSLDEKISAVFLSIGIPPHIKGYGFLRDAIKLVVGDRTLIDGITKVLYPRVAAQHSTSPSRVERAIRHAIDVAWQRGRIENINSFLGYKIYNCNDKPTNGEFIALMADKLLMDRSA